MTQKNNLLLIILNSMKDEVEGTEEFIKKVSKNQKALYKANNMIRDTRYKNKHINFVQYKNLDKCPAIVNMYRQYGSSCGNAIGIFFICAGMVKTSEGYFQVSSSQLCTLLKIGKTTIKKSFKMLCENGFMRKIYIDPNRQKAPIYQINTNLISIGVSSGDYGYSNGIKEESNEYYLQMQEMFCPEIVENGFAIKVERGLTEDNTEVYYSTLVLKEDCLINAAKKNEDNTHK